VPSPLVIPERMTLPALADVRKLFDHQPADHREKATWRYVADRLDEAARGLSLVEVTCAWCGRWEGIACRSK
jgi:hypothetical protein